MDWLISIRQIGGKLVIADTKEKTCKGCPDRTVEPNCHMTCEDYLRRVEKTKELKELREKATKPMREATLETRDAIAKMRRRLGRRNR